MSMPSPFPTTDRLVGRDREQTALHAVLDRALAGQGSLVLIGGEAGIGKTALAEWLLTAAADQGCLVLIGRCYDLSETPPYGPWQDLFARAPTAGLPPLPVAVRPAEQGGEVLASQEAIITRVLAYLAALAAQQPLVVLLDDLHWADPASLDLLRVLARDLAGLPLLVLATYRADEVDRQHPLSRLLPAFVREARAERLALPPLDDADLRALVGGRYALPPAAETRLVAYLAARADGNPFFAGELLRALEEARTLCPDGAGWTLGDLAGAGIPSLLRQVIDARVARLGDDAGRLLAVAATIGQAVPLDLWATVTGVDEEALADAVGRATVARVLTETPGGAGVRFAHALVRAALYEAIPLPRRRALHRRVAEALLATPAPDPDAVAGHLQRACDPRAVEWLIQAGHRAYRTFAHQTAAERYASALALTEQDGANPRLQGWCLLYLAQARYLDDALGGIARMEAALRLAAVVGDRTLAAYARYLLGFHQCAVGDFRRGIVAMSEAVVVLDELTADEQALVAVQGDRVFEYEGTLALRFAYVGRYAEARALALRSLAKRPNPRANYVLGEVHAALGQASAAQQAWARGREAVRWDGDHWSLGIFIMLELHGAVLPYQADDLPARQRLADQSEQAITAAGDLHRVESVRAGRLPLLALEGQWEEARTIATAVCASNRAYFALAALLLARIALAQGDTALVSSLVQRLLPAGPAEEPGGTWHFDALGMQRLAASVALDTGDLPTAHAWLSAHDRWLAWNGAVRSQAEGQLGWAAYHRAAGDPALAHEHAERALAHASEPRQPLALLAAHRLLGELATADGRYAEAQAHLAAALALADARATLTALQALPALARCDTLAALLPSATNAPAEPPAAPPADAYPAHLTAREVEVLRFVAAGASNREMAALLCRSERTIERHLENIYRKIDARNRADAVAFALRQNLA